MNLPQPHAHGAGVEDVDGARHGRDPDEEHVGGLFIKNINK